MLKNPIDRPFRSREEIEREQALEAQYREVGISELRVVLGPDLQPDHTVAQ